MGKREQLSRLLPEEEAAIVWYAKAHPPEGYRRLCWMMVDEDVVYVSPSTVYNVLDRHDLLYRWKRPQASVTKVTPPNSPNQRLAYRHHVSLAGGALVLLRGGD